MTLLLRGSASSRRAFVTGGIAMSLAVGRRTSVVARRPSVTHAATAEADGQPSGPHMLALMPSPGDISALHPDFPLQYVDIAAALRPHDLQPLAAHDDIPVEAGLEVYLQALSGVQLLSTGLGEAMINPDAWQEMFGFHPFAVHAIADHGTPEDYCAVIQAAFDRDRVEQAWTRLGYSLMPGSDTIMRLELDESARLNLGLGRGIMGLFMKSYDHAAVLAEDLIILSTTQQRVEQAQALMTGAVGSIMDHRSVAACADLLPSATTLAWLVGGAKFLADPVDAPLVPLVPGANIKQESHDKLTAELATDQELLQQLDAEYGPMPALELVTLAGTATDQHILMVCPVDPATAATALKIVSRRFEQMSSRSTTKPYTELFRIADITVSESGAGMLTLDPLAEVSLFRLYQSGDLRFVNYG